MDEGFVRKGKSTTLGEFEQMRSSTLIGVNDVNGRQV